MRPYNAFDALAEQAGAQPEPSELTDALRVASDLEDESDDASGQGTFSVCGSHPTICDLPFPPLELGCELQEDADSMLEDTDVLEDSASRALETRPILRLAKTSSHTLVQTVDSVWVFDSALPERAEGAFPVYRLAALNGPCMGMDLIVKCSNDSEGTRALMHEAQVLAAAREHLHVADLAYPLITDGHSGFLIQSRPYGSLAQLAGYYAGLHAHSALTWSPLLETMTQAFLAVHSVHQLDLVHSNVRYDTVHFYGSVGMPLGRGEAAPPVTIKLTGLDASLAPGALALASPGPDILVAPEAQAGVLTADHAMDVYSVAVALVGFLREVVRPLHLDGPGQGAAAPRCELSPTAWLPPGVAAIIARCAQHEASSRCTAAEAAAAVLELLKTDLADHVCGRYD